MNKFISVSLFLVTSIAGVTGGTSWYNFKTANTAKADIAKDSVQTKAAEITSSDQMLDVSYASDATAEVDELPAPALSQKDLEIINSAFEKKLDPINKKFETLEGKISTVSKNVSTLSESLTKAQSDNTEKYNKLEKKWTDFEENLPTTIENAVKNALPQQTAAVAPKASAETAQPAPAVSKTVKENDTPAKPTALAGNVVNGDKTAYLAFFANDSVLYPCTDTYGNYNGPRTSGQVVWVYPDKIVAAQKRSTPAQRTRQMQMPMEMPMDMQMDCSSGSCQPMMMMGGCSTGSCQGW